MIDKILWRSKRVENDRQKRLDFFQQGRAPPCETVKKKMAGMTGLEPATSAVTGQRSNASELHPHGREGRSWTGESAFAEPHLAAWLPRVSCYTNFFVAVGCLPSLTRWTSQHTAFSKSVLSAFLLDAITAIAKMKSISFFSLVVIWI